MMIRTVLVLVCAAITAGAAGRCKSLSEPAKVKLAAYVHDKFGFPSVTTIKVGAVEPVGATCFTRLTFVRDMGGSPAQKTVLYLSPDQRYLSHDLLDTQGTLPEARTPRAAAPVRTTITLDVRNAPLLGSETAPLTIVEFTDFQCPYCNRFFESTFPEIRRKYIDSGQARFYSMDLPLAFHQNALRAAQAAKCAGDQGAFWQMHDMMQAQPAHLEISDLAGYAGKIGIDADVLLDCIKTEKYKASIQKEAEDAAGMGAQGTPAFIIGKSTPGGVQGELVIGALPETVFDETLKRFMAPVNK